MASSYAASPGAAGRPLTDFEQVLLAVIASEPRSRRIGATLLAHPAGEPLWEAIVRAMLAHYEDATQAPDGE
jgi:hypothetical protein